MRSLRTCDRKSANGIPLSLANAQVRRDEEARNPNEAQIVRAITMALITDVPAWDFVALKNTSMKSYPVALSRAASRSPTQKRKARTMAKPRVPFSMIVAIMHQGTMTEALTTSSAVVSLDIDYFWLGSGCKWLTHMTGAIVS